MEKHDVVIVGAGPAGLKVAELLGNAGKDVLVIERKREKEIGEKTCAGGLTPKTMKFIPEELYEKVFHSCSVYLNNQAIEYKNENPLIATVDRHKLGQYMLKKAEEAGASIRAGVGFKTLKRGENSIVLDNGEEIGYRYLIGADGSTSKISKALGLKSNLMVGIDFQASGSFDELAFYLDVDKFGLAGACIFPHKNFAHVEAGTLTSLMTTSELRSNFEKWCYEKGIDISKARFSAAPLNFSYNGFKHGNIFLVGDAASFLCTIDGEGIYQAIKSGEIAAKAIIDPKWNYKPELQDLLKYHKMGAPFINLIRVIPKSILYDAGKTAFSLSPKLVPMLNTFINTFKFIPEMGVKYLAR